MRRFFLHGELHLVLLALLAGRPMHGYELMSELAERTGGGYRPSPGSIYPAVRALEDEGLLEGRAEDDRRVYRLTPAGRRALAARRSDVVGFEVRTGTRVRADGSLDAALERFAARVRAVRGADPSVVEGVLERAAIEIESREEEGSHRG